MKALAQYKAETKSVTTTVPWNLNIEERDKVNFQSLPFQTLVFFDIGEMLFYKYDFSKGRPSNSFPVVINTSVKSRLAFYNEVVPDGDDDGDFDLTDDEEFLDQLWRFALGESFEFCSSRVNYEMYERNMLPKREIDCEVPNGITLNFKRPTILVGESTPSYYFESGVSLHPALSDLVFQRIHGVTSVKHVLNRHTFDRVTASLIYKNGLTAIDFFTSHIEETDASFLPVVQVFNLKIWEEKFVKVADLLNDPYLFEGKKFIINDGSERVAKYVSGGCLVMGSTNRRVYSSDRSLTEDLHLPINENEKTPYRIMRDSHPIYDQFPY